MNLNVETKQINMLIVAKLLLIRLSFGSYIAYYSSITYLSVGKPVSRMQRLERELVRQTARLTFDRPVRWSSLCGGAWAGGGAPLRTS